MLSSSALSCSDLLLVVCVSVGDISLRVAMWKAINSYEAERSGISLRRKWNGMVLDGGRREGKGREGKWKSMAMMGSL